MATTTFTTNVSTDKDVFSEAKKAVKEETRKEGKEAIKKATTQLIWWFIKVIATTLLVKWVWHW